jgi:hypothetical protein
MADPSELPETNVHPDYHKWPPGEQAKYISHRIHTLKEVVPTLAGPAGEQAKAARQKRASRWIDILKGLGKK